MPAKANGMRATIARIVDECLDGWQAADPEKIIAVFDIDYPGFLYQPMELDRPVDDLAAYAKSVLDDRVGEFRELRWTNIEYDVLGDAAWAYVDLVRHTVAPDGREARGAYRSSLFMARRGADWKVVHYHESAQPYAPRPRVIGAGAPASAPERPPSADTQAALRRAEDMKKQLHAGDPLAVAERMLETFIVGWEAWDVELAYSWWDQAYDNHLYLALEIASPARRWSDIETYRQWQREDRTATGTRWDWRVPLAPEDRRVQMLGDDLMLVYSNLHARGIRPERPEPPEEQAPFFTYRVSWLLRRTAGEWGIIHYHESRPTSGPTEILALGLHPSGPPGQP